MKFVIPCIIILTVSISIHAQKIGIQPSILEFHLSPGESEAQVVRITNLSEKKIVFEAYLADWLRDSTGAHQYFKPDTLPQSCANWISLGKNLIEVEPGKSQELLVRLQAPVSFTNTNEMKWAMLFLQSATEKDSMLRNSKQFNTQIRELLRVGVHIYQTPLTTTKMSAKAIALKEVNGVPNNYNFYMENTGEVMLVCKTHIELTNIETGKEYKLDKIEYPVFPKSKRIVRLFIPDSIPKGKYSALALLDIGEEETIEAIEKNIEIK